MYDKKLKDRLFAKEKKKWDKKQDAKHTGFQQGNTINSNCPKFCILYVKQINPSFTFHPKNVLLSNAFDSIWWS